MIARAVPPPTPRKVTRAEYHRMGELGFFRGERVELVEGIVVRMSPIGPAHASVVQRLLEHLVPRLLGRATVRIQQPLLAHDDSEPEPDVAIVPVGQYADRHPEGALLAIEVALSSLEYDRTTKGPLYAASGVDEYWVVDVTGRAVEVYTAPQNGGYEAMRRLVSGDRLAPAAFTEVEITVAELLD
jgi:Uma2 family endonuclease